MNPKTVLERFTADEDAVSPVIGVILMVAITVILAAVIGTFVLGLGQDIQTNVQAGASTNFDSANDEISVTFTSAQDSATELNLNVTNISNSTTFGSRTISNVGSSEVYTAATLAEDNANVPDDTRFRLDVTAVNGDRSTSIVSKAESL